MTPSLLLLALLTQVPAQPKTFAKPGSEAPFVINVQGSATGTPLPVTGSFSAAGAADTVGATATYNSNSDCGFVALAGQTGAAFFLAAGTLAATLTPAVSVDSTNGTNGTWTNSEFVDVSGNTASTLAVTDPNAATARGLVLMAGVRYARVCTTAFTSGSTTGFLVASTPLPRPPAAGADVTDQADRELGLLANTTEALALAVRCVTADGADFESCAGSGGGSGGTQYDEDTAGQAGDDITMAGVVRVDTPGTLAGTDGDRTQLQVDAAGALRVTGAVTATVTDGSGALNTIVDSSALPTGASTSANQTTMIGHVDGVEALLATIDADTSTLSGAVSGSEMQVDVVTLPATPAGNNNIGDVDVATIAAGNNNIGDVDVASIAAGNNNIGDVDVASLPSVTIGTFPDNEPINVAQMNGTAVTMGNGASGTGVQRVTIANDSTGTVIVTQATAANLNVRTDVSGATGSAVPARAHLMAGTDGTNLVAPYIDPCAREAKSVYVVNVASATTTEIANQVASEFFYICSINLVAAAAQAVAIVEDDTDACASPTAGLNGGTTAATGWSFAANGGLTLGNGTATVMKTATANRYFCFMTSTTGQLSGTITYVSAP